MEELVAERVAEEMEKRKDEIEAEVLRRVEEAKTLMEQQGKMSLHARQSLRSFELWSSQRPIIVVSSYHGPLPSGNIKA